MVLTASRLARGSSAHEAAAHSLGHQPRRGGVHSVEEARHYARRAYGEAIESGGGDGCGRQHHAGHGPEAERKVEDQRLTRRGARTRESRVRGPICYVGASV